MFNRVTKAIFVQFFADWDQVSPVTQRKCGAAAREVLEAMRDAFRDWGLTDFSDEQVVVVWQAGIDDVLRRG
jgi:3-oxoacyl-(acyl-carrier-protein) synthase